MTSEKGMCIFYLQNNCRNGDACGFLHPAQPPTKLDVCKDFQNKKCPRHKCKFMHISIAEENAFYTTGVLPSHNDKMNGHPGMMAGPPGPYGYGSRPMMQRPPMQRPPMQRPPMQRPPMQRPPMYPSTPYGMGAPVRAPAVLEVDTRDVCRDFLNGKCDSSRDICKFRHVSQREVDLERELENMHALVQSAQKAAHNARMMVSQQQPMAGAKRKMTEDAAVTSEVETLRTQVAELTKEVSTLRELNKSLTQNQQAANTDPYHQVIPGLAYQPF